MYTKKHVHVKKSRIGKKTVK